MQLKGALSLSAKDIRQFKCSFTAKILKVRTRFEVYVKKKKTYTYLDLIDVST